MMPQTSISRQRAHIGKHFNQPKIWWKQDFFQFSQGGEDGNPLAPVRSSWNISPALVLRRDQHVHQRNMQSYSWTSWIYDHGSHFWVLLQLKMDPTLFVGFISNLLSEIWTFDEQLGRLHWMKQFSSEHLESVTFLCPKWLFFKNHSISGWTWGNNGRWM